MFGICLLSKGREVHCLSSTRHSEPVQSPTGQGGPTFFQSGGIVVSLSEIRNLDYTILLCNRLEETRVFYRDVMGFPVETDRENWFSFRVGAMLLTLRTRTSWTVCDDGKSVPGAAAVQLAFRVSPPAVDRCHEELVAKGVPILREPTDLPDWRHRTVFFRDPEDNIIEIYAEY